MNCSDYSDAIAEFVDGSLDPARQRALERHVEGCAACRALVADLKTIQAAAFTLDRVDLPPHLLGTVRAAIAQEPAPATRGRLIAWPQTRSAWGVWLAAAAALLIVTTAGTYRLLRAPTAQQTNTTATTTDGAADVVSSVQSELNAAEDAIRGLEQIARNDSGALDPQTAAVLQKNLAVIDQAIGESRAALIDEPASADAQESLFDAMRSKVALLQQTVELINEMRQGNQAETGRLIRGLNQ